MAKDFKLVWNTDYQEADLDYDLNAGDLSTDKGLETAVIISLFTDQRAKDDDTLPDIDSDDKRGWWGDQVSDIEDDEIGSRLWIHAERAKATQEVLNLVKKDIEEALQWLIDDGIAASVSVTTERQKDSMLAFEVQIKKKDGTTTAVRFDDNWTAQINEN